MCRPTRQWYEVRLVVDVVVVVLAFLVVLLTLDRLGEHCHWQRPPGPPQVPETPHHRRDELQHCCLPPLQLMSSMPILMPLLVVVLPLVLLLVLLRGLSHQVVVLERRWSGEVHLVSQAVVGACHVVIQLAVLAHVDPRTCTRPPCCCAWGGPGPSQPCSQDTASEWA